MKLQNISNRNSEITLFIRNDDGSQIVKKDKSFLPYYFQKVNDEKYDALGYDGTKLKKMLCVKPRDVKEQRNSDSWEADIIYTARYVLDNISKIEKSLTRIIFFDIEVQTNNLDEITNLEETKQAKYPISCITIYDNYKKKYCTFFIKDFDSEYDMLEKFCETIKKLSPDILVAWNCSFDYNYCFYRINDFAKKISLIGEDHYRNGGIYPAGISIVDYMGLYAKYTLFKKDSYALMNVANDELDYEIEEDFDFMDVDIAKTKNKLDVRKLVELENKLHLFDYFDEVRLLSKCSWESLPAEMRNYAWQSNNSKVIDMLALAEAKKLNVVLPSKFQDNEREDVEGAYRITYGTGLYKDLASVDISGAYPSDIIGFNLSPENYVDKPQKDTIKIDIHSRETQEYKTTYHVKQNEKAILPSLVRHLLKIKNELKDRLNSLNKDSKEYKQTKIAYNSRKALVNSSFGVILLPFFRLYSKQVGESITYLIRDLLHYLEDKLQKENKKIQYIDTDSFMMEGKEDITEQLNEWTKQWAKEKYNNDKIDIEFEFQGFFSSIFIQALCRYKGRLETSTGQSVEIRGIQSKRKDAGSWVKSFQTILYDKILDGISKKDLIEWIKVQIEEMKKVNIIDIAVPCKMNKKREDYKKKEIYFEAMDETQKLVLEFNKKVGDRFYWIYCKEPRVLALGKKYYEHIKRDNIDWKSVLERNIFNLLCPIFKGLNWETDLLDLAEKYQIILGSQYRNKLLQDLPNYEELKKYYSAREAKKRIKSSSIDKT